MNVIDFDHIVLCVADVGRTVALYESLLGMEPRQARPGKWSLHFGRSQLRFALRMPSEQIRSSNA